MQINTAYPRPKTSLLIESLRQERGWGNREQFVCLRESIRGAGSTMRQLLHHCTDCHWLSSQQLCDAEMWTIWENVQPMFTFKETQITFTWMTNELQNQQLLISASVSLAFSDATIATLRRTYFHPHFQKNCCHNIFFPRLQPMQKTQGENISRIT